MMRWALVETIEYPSGDTIAYGYDMTGNVIRRTTTRDSEAITTHYKRDNLGRVSYKQYSNQIEWTEPNSILPFDEILYDAMGNRSLMICVDNDNDAELNAYGYNGFGLMDSAFESFGGFGHEVSYGYDQRGLLVWMMYPNEKVVAYARVALGRIESVTYDDRTLVEYKYLGDTVIQKTMAGADMEYAAAIDPLGRITGETYSRISNSQTVLDFEYEYHQHSHRLVERNGIDYGFDTLGRVISEDSTSYTCDILGNPTNAAGDGLAYLLDEEERIKQVDDAVGTLAVYSYDRLGRRNKKTVSEVVTSFVYDQMGNIIAEYEDGEWLIDYVYGAKGELICIEMPEIIVHNPVRDLFFSFVEAWLCWPDCTQDDLEWDANEDSQINLIDWAAHCDDFIGAFDSSPLFPRHVRYLLTDMRNSVVGKVNPDGTVDEIAYTAFGTPMVNPETDLESLAILWNGYYYDYETGNYYLRNRYYSPVERRFLTEDPHGITPDGNWNNPFGIRRQYSDGFGLQVYAQGDPVNNRDDWGLWKYALPAAQRTKEAKTFIEASGVWEMKHNIKGLAQLVRLNEEEFDKWGKRAIHKVNGIKKCGAWVPNTIPIIVSEMSWLQYQYTVANAMKLLSTIERHGFKVEYYDRYVSSVLTKD